MPHRWFHMGSSKWKSIFPVKSTRNRGVELSTWEHLLSWAGRGPEQLRCLGTVSQVHPQQHSWAASRASPTPTPPRLPAQPQLCHHEFLHKHTQPASSVSVNEPRQQNGIFQPDQPQTSLPALVQNFTLAQAAAGGAPKTTAPNTCPRCPTLQPPLPCHTHSSWNLPANFLPLHWMEIKITTLI